MYTSVWLAMGKVSASAFYVMLCLQDGDEDLLYCYVATHTAHTKLEQFNVCCRSGSQAESHHHKHHHHYHHCRIGRSLIPMPSASNNVTEPRNELIVPVARDLRPIVMTTHSHAQAAHFFCSVASGRRLWWRTRHLLFQMR